MLYAILYGFFFFLWHTFRRPQVCVTLTLWCRSFKAASLTKGHVVFSYMVSQLHFDSGGNKNYSDCPIRNKINGRLRNFYLEAKQITAELKIVGRSAAT